MGADKDPNITYLKREKKRDNRESFDALKTVIITRSKAMGLLHLSFFLSICRSINPFVCVCLSVNLCLSINLYSFVCLSINVYVSIDLSVCTYLSTIRQIWMSVCICLCLICLSIHQCICLSVSIDLSVYY